MITDNWRLRVYRPRLVSCLVNSLHNSVADFRGWQGAAPSHCGAMANAMARSRNAARREKTQRLVQRIHQTGTLGAGR